MRDKVKVTLVQFAPVWLKRQENAERMKNFADKAAGEGAQLIVFPELANIGYIVPVQPGQVSKPELNSAEFATKYIRAAEPIPGPTTELLAKVARKHEVYVVVGIAQLHPTIPMTLYNSAALIGPSGVIGIQHKMHLPAQERHYFCPGNTAEVYSTDLGNIGMAICYDGRFPEMIRVLALKGAEIICTIWAVPKAKEIIGTFDSLKYRAHTRANENLVYFIACSRSGREGNTEFIGRSAVAAPNGEVIAFCDSEEETTLTAELYNDELIKARTLLNVFSDRRPEMYSIISRQLSQGS